MNRSSFDAPFPEAGSLAVTLPMPQVTDVLLVEYPAAEK